MPDSSADRDPLDRLAEEFVARYRAGERPSVTEYAERLPARADEVRDLFPALVEMEQLKPATGDRTGDFTPATEPTDPNRVGEFRIVRRVGQGGMGVVYEAVQESLGRHVALKMLPAEAVADPKKLERFRREAKSAARLHHTNIVPVFGVGEADGRHYYAMQFIAGHPLDAVIDEVRRLRAKTPTVPPVAPRPVSEAARALLTGTFAAPPPDPSDVAPTVTHAAADAPAPEVPPASADSSAFSGILSAEGHYWGTVARIGAQVADALAYAHGQGILHRDIKPANLLLDPRGTVWVTDFGLAKSADADDLTHAGDIVGTLRYMAPERFDGQGDARADTYALGLTLYELLTLTPAFAADTRAKLVEQVLAANPPKPRSINPAFPRDLETIVLKAIARDPAMRYASAADLADDLRLYLEDRPIRARRASSAEQALRWCRRNPAVAALLTAVLLVFAVGAAVSAYFAVRAENAREGAERSERAAVGARAAAENAQHEAEAKRAEAQEARARENVALLATRRKVTRLDLATGARFADSGDPDATLLWYARGWRDDPDAGQNEPDHRLRLGLTLLKKPELVGLAVHDEPLLDARIDDAGTRSLARTRSGKAVLWDISAGRLVARCEHPGGVTTVALRRDGGFALTGGADGNVRVWDTAGGKLLRIVPHGAPVAQVEWRPGGSTFATAGGDLGVRLWDAAGEKPAGALKGPGAYHVAFSADGARAVTATTAGFAQVWDLGTGVAIGPALPHTPPDDYDRFWNVRSGPTLSPDGSLVLSSTGSYGKKNYVLTCSDADTGRRRWATQHPYSGAYCQTFSSDGTRLLLAHPKAALSDPATGRSAATMSTPRECQAAAFLANNRVATISTGGLLQIWDTAVTPPVPTGLTVQTAESIRTLAVLPDGRRVFVASADGTARLYDLSPRGTQVPPLESGRADKFVVVRGTRLVVYSPDGRSECECGPDALRVGPRGGNPLPTVIPVARASAQFSRDGTALVTRTASELQRWDASTGKPLGPPVPFAAAGRSTAVISGDLLRAVLSDLGRREVRVVDLTSGKALLARTYPPTEETTTNAPALSRDGRWLATGDFAFAGAVEVWDTAAGKRVSRFFPHRGNLQVLDLSADGSRLLVCSSDTTARLWDARTGQPLGPVLRHTRFCRRGELADDGRRAVTMDSGGTVYLWDALGGDRFGQWGTDTGAPQPAAVWLAADGKTLYYFAQGEYQRAPIRPLGASAEVVPPLLELATGQRIDPVTEGIEYLPPDNFSNNPGAYLRAFRAWKGISPDGS